MAEKTLGQKIRDFRMQNGMSQFELELQAHLAAGSISRIEKDKTNPSKETLLLISRVLGLDEYQEASLFNLSQNLTAKTLAVINEFSVLNDLDEVLQVAANEINFQLGYISSSILLLKEDTLWAMTFGMDPISLRVIEVIGQPFRKLYVNNEIDAKNILLKCALEGKFYESTNIYDFARGAIGWKTSKVMEKMLGFKKGLAVPLLTGNKSIGVLYLSKSGREDYEFEKPVVQQIATQLAIKIESIRQIEHFKEQLKNAK